MALARAHDVLPVAIVLDLPERVCHERNQQRNDRSFGPHVIRNQKSQLHRGLRGLKREGFRNITVLRSTEEVEAAAVTRARMWTDRKDEHGPFDIIGDIHGCHGELQELLAKLGYIRASKGDHLAHPEGRSAIFLGDLVDRGPDSPGVLRTVMAMVRAGAALCVPGNHDVKLLKKLRGRDVKLTHGLAETVAQMEAEPPEFHEQVAAFIDGLVSHCVLDDGRLVVAHAGLKEAYHGRASGRVREFCLYGESTGEIDAYGLPVRADWASEYRGRATVVYGHTPTLEAEWINRTICLDTGCVFGGALTALRYPENDVVQVAARKVYYEPVRPLADEGKSASQPKARPYHDLLDIGDVQGKRVIETRLARTVTVQEENAAAALEVMSRFAVDPRWLIYLPPTMSPSETAAEGDHLEHPREAFQYFRAQGVSEVVCQEKHMGSRAVLVVCRDVEAAQQRFGMADARAGVITTRTGRPFFHDAELEAGVLERVQGALDRSGFWETHGTKWVCLDAEILPWSAKAEELLRSQYAAVGAAATASLGEAADLLAQAVARGAGDPGLAQHTAARAEMAQGFVTAYQQYCWKVEAVDDLQVAPFHLLASEGRVHIDRDHSWHMETLGQICAQGEGFLKATATRRVDLSDEGDQAQAIAWWTDLTAQGGEGIVIKPLDWVQRGKKGLVQPALKCRGREYLRIIYGPEYTSEQHLERLRKRGLGRKRSLALREFALGIEALQRFVDGEPLHRVHECVFGVLALESEPVDPRL